MKFLRILSLLLLLSVPLEGQQIYRNSPLTGLGICRDDSGGLICLRKLSVNDHTFYFTVSPFTLKTRIVTSDSIAVFQTSWEMIRFLYNSTAYLKALKHAEKLSYALQDAGYTRFFSDRKGIDLTIDLCPSLLPLDRVVFNDLIKEISKVEKPVPLAICITGSWMRNHQDDLKWLDSLVMAKELSIVWINHSFNHFTFKDAPLKTNFMLAPGTNVDSEVLNNEIALLQNNLTPSIFFRFPGLVSDTIIYKRIIELGLIPVGSDAWLAKGQHPGNGSIVLIHANGNEPVGVHDFINLLKSKQKDVLSGRWELFDLRESLIENENKWDH